MPQPLPSPMLSPVDLPRCWRVRSSRRLPPSLPVLLPLLLFAGCTTYRPLPLSDHELLVAAPAQLLIDTAAMPTTALRTHLFDPSDGLDIDEVAMVAVANNPELRTLRADAGIARAQAFASGLLPDPVLALSRDRVLGNPEGAGTAYTAGLPFDLGMLLTRSSIRAAAAADNRKTDLNLLWQEWQTVAKARLLFVKLDALARSLALLDGQLGALQGRYGRTRTAVERGLLSSDTATPQLAALQDVVRQRHDIERQANQARHDLNALLGVAPTVMLTLVGSAHVPVLDAAQVREALATGARRRPDLLALQAGYAAEDDRYRAALRAQFPAITVGPTRSRDTSNVTTVGFSLGIALPLFNRNRGNIAIEEATRQKLQLEYQQRLDATVQSADRLLAEEAILLRQRADIDSALTELAAAAQRANAAFTARSIDALTLTNTESALLAKQIERIAVEQALWEQAIALQALVAIDLLAPQAARGAAT